MANIALIVAGGKGLRMGEEIPKQFIEVNGQPIIVYTLKAFQRHALIDAIEVVCLDGWQETLKSYVKQYGIDKVQWIVSGGDTVQESIRNGVYHLEGICQKEDIVIVHDGIRPIVEPSVLTDVISVSQEKGNAVTAMPYNEQIFVADNEESTVRYIPRETVRRVSTPQAYRFDLLDAKYHEAFEKKIGIYGSSYANTMMTDLGVRLYFAAGSDRNIKLTTKDDLEMFKGYLKMDDCSWLKE